MSALFDTAKQSSRYAYLLIARGFTATEAGYLPLSGDMKHLVFLFPGFLGTNSVMRPMARRFEAKKIPAFSMNIAIPSFISYKLTKRKMLEWSRMQCERFPNIERIDIVAHSMGGIIARELLNEGWLADKDVRLVTLGSPFFGTWSAVLAAPISPTAFRLVRPIAVKIRKRKNRPPRREVPFLSIAGRYDLLAPPKSCRHPAAEYLLVEADHSGLIFKEDVFNEICSFLEI